MAVLVILESESGKEYCLQVRNLAARFVDFFSPVLEAWGGEEHVPKIPITRTSWFQMALGYSLGG